MIGMNIEATFHKAIKRFMSKRQQGFTMDAFRTVMRALVENGAALRPVCDRLAPWMSAALDDPKACAEFKQCAEAFLKALHEDQFIGITAEMVREAEAHFPAGQFPPGNAYPRWEWYADFYNNAMRNPNLPCPCCNVTPAGDICDHLPAPPLPVIRVSSPFGEGEPQ